jgi:Replication-relaxation
METSSLVASIRRPRFRRASEPPAFRLTDDDGAIMRHLARHRFLRSTHIAALVGRSLDRTNDRLSKLFHAGYIDRPRAQLDWYPSGSAPLVYALAGRGARFLTEHDGIEFPNPEWSRKNREARRPFIEHQLEIVDFHVALLCAAYDCRDVRILHPEDIIAAAPPETQRARDPFALKVKLSDRGTPRDIGLLPDLVFGLMFSEGTRRFFMVEIDRGTMPIVRHDLTQTSFEKKMRAYLAAHAAGVHGRHFGWKAFRVLVVTTDRHRLQSMTQALHHLHIPHSLGSSLFFFATREELHAADPLTYGWQDGAGKPQRLMK